VVFSDFMKYHASDSDGSFLLLLAGWEGLCVDGALAHGSLMSCM